MNVSGVPLFFKMFIVFAASGVEYLNNGSEAADECAFGGQCAYCNASFCYTCKTGFFGMFCEKKCSYCPSGTACERENGLCKDGCKDGSSGHFCNVSCDGRCQSCDKRNAANCVQCKNNQTCVLACPADCQGHNCNSNGSYCTKGCKPGSWGHSCEKDCLADCSIVGCNRENGTCPEDEPSADVYKLAVPVLSILLPTLLLVMLAILLWKRKSARHQDSHAVVYKPENKAEKRSGTSEENMATSRTNEVQDNVELVSGNEERFYFSPLCKNDDLQNQYSPLAESICTSRSETVNIAID